MQGNFGVFNFQIFILANLKLNVFTFGGAKRCGSDREYKYFPMGMNALELLWCYLTLLLLGI